MTANRDPERLIRAFLDEGEERLNLPIYDAVRAGIEQKRQRAFIGPWRTPIMSKFLAIGLGAAAVVVIGVFLGAQLLGSPNGGTGTGASPTPSATVEPTPVPTPTAATLASGSFTADLGDFGRAFEINATGTVDDVSGTLEVSNPGGTEGAYSVDLQCARSVADGPLVIGGEVSESTYDFVSAGAYVAMAFSPGTPVRTVLAIDVVSTDEVPIPAESCSAYLDTLLADPQYTVAVDVWPSIVGDLELGQ
jgi:hypothetical protein